MTQPPNDPTDLYGVIAGINPSMSPEALYGRLNGQILLLDDMQTKGQSVNPNYRARVALARDVLGTAGPKQQYDAARASGGRPTDDELVAMVGIRASMRATHKRSSWKSPGMIVGYAIFGVIAVVLVLVLATSCSDDGEPAAVPNPGPVSTTTDGETYTIEDVKSGRAKFETVRTIDLAAVVPDAASFAESAQTAEYLARGADGTLTVAWIPKSDSYNVVRLDVSGDTVKVVEQKSLSRTAWYDAANAAEADDTRSRNIRGAGEMSEAVALADGRIFAFANGYGGKIYELKAVAK